MTGCKQVQIPRWLLFVLDLAFIRRRILAARKRSTIPSARSAATRSRDIQTEERTVNCSSPSGKLSLW